MSKKKHSVLGMAALAAAGAGAAVLANKSREEKQITEAHVDPNYRNTERGKNEKNSKGIYYTNGNYEAFARPEKPEGVDDKHAYIVGSGLASLAAACFLVRDAQMPGSFSAGSKPLPFTVCRWSILGPFKSLMSRRMRARFFTSCPFMGPK